MNIVKIIPTIEGGAWRVRENCGTDKERTIYGPANIYHCLRWYANEFGRSYASS